MDLVGQRYLVTVSGNDGEGNLAIHASCSPSFSSCNSFFSIQSYHFYCKCLKIRYAERMRIVVVGFYSNLVNYFYPPEFLDNAPP